MVTAGAAGRLLRKWTHRPRRPPPLGTPLLRLQIQERGQDPKRETAPSPLNHHRTATAQTSRERFLNPKPSQRSGLSSTSGASNGFGVVVVLGAASAVLVVELTTLKGLVVVEVGPLP